MKTPFLSIVIANYNFGNLLSVAIESIIQQDCQDYEIIIVDGGSKDNSVDVIKKYERFISWWVSEPDKGQTNAFNKGFAHAKGDFFTWLNADDILLPGTISALKRTILKNPTADFVTGNMVRFNEVDHARLLGGRIACLDSYRDKEDHWAYMGPRLSGKKVFMKSWVH